MGVALKVSGERALFARPELPVERVTYDVLTPSAAIGILEAIHWRPSIRWVIDRITVLRPIRHEQLMVNGVAFMATPNRAAISVSDSTSRMQRRQLILRNVAYLVEAHAEPTGKACERELAEGVSIVTKHEEMLRRHVRRGQCHHQPSLGVREFAARFEPPDGEASVHQGEQHLGLVLHSIDFEKRSPRLFRAVMRDGVIAVPKLGSGEVYAQ